jgi:predicted nucleotidyltransferase component of viral defense system
MIPRPYITEWRSHAPWRDDAHVEQDLILSRLIIDFYNEPVLAENLCFRGGTALHKLFLAPAVRYSEDIDFVQKEALPIGIVMEKIREICNPLLGQPRTNQKKGRVVFIYRIDSEIPPVLPMRIKIEINTREHFNIFYLIDKSYMIESAWFSGKSLVKTYSLEELLATKLRALYQRKKGRDLFDLWYALEKGNVDMEKVVFVFKKYMAFMDLSVSSSEFQQNLELKLNDLNFKEDIMSLVRDGIVFSPEEAYFEVLSHLIKRL